MTDMPETNSSRPKAKYINVQQVVVASLPSTQVSTPQVRTVPVRSAEGHVSLRYTPLDQGPQGDTSTSE